jgi:poly-gamma-glutamate synthesis protein (capsule biosynthesis protein)
MRKSLLPWLLLCSVATVPAVIGQAPTAPIAPRDRARELALKVADGFTLAAVGDVIELRPLAARTDPGFAGAVKILKDADVAFANMETNIADIPNFDEPFRGFVAVKAVAADVKALGIDIVNRANNHLPDGGIEGMFATNRLLDEAGLVHAGTGRSLAEARMPQYLETAKGRVGLVGMASSFAAQMMAGDQEGISPPRPGLNGLRVTQSLVVNAAQIEAMRKIRDSVYDQRSAASTPVPVPSNEAADRLQFFGASLKAGDKPGAYSYAMNPDDFRQIVDSIRNGKFFSHFMMATIHSHESAVAYERMHFSDRPTDFLVELAHASIDNGADAFLGHGVHVLRGVEIYKGRPIFYGLGEFVRQMEFAWGGSYLPPADPRNPDATVAERKVEGVYRAAREPINYEGVIAVSRYDRGQVSEVRLYPVDLGYDAPIADAGMPRLASPTVARAVLERMQRLSAPFGTTIAVEGSVGVIRPKPPATSSGGRP